MNIRTATRLAALPLLAAGIAASLTGTANAATLSTHDLPVKAYSHGTYSTELTITNHTGQPLTLDDDHTTLNAGGVQNPNHWVQAPQETLNDGASETVTAYTTELGGLDMAVTYTLPNGEYAYFSADNDLAGSNSTKEGVYGAFKDNAFNTPDSATKDASYTGKGSAHHGVHVTAKAEIDQAS